MRIIQDQNKFLDELENLARPKSYTFVAVKPRALTLKSDSGYLETNRIASLISEDKPMEYAVSKTAEQIEASSLNSLFGRFLKRCCDLVGASIGLVLTLPFWIIIPIIIKLSSRGPVFYTQTRVGRNRRESRRRLIPQDGAGNSRNRERRRDNTFGETFQVIKFRTMIDQAERDSGPVWAAKNDARITAVGSILRKLRLDEIPQFLNVLAGDMSLVGPRPERPNFVRDLSDKIDDYHLRLDVNPE
ncbi:MAG TPA: sugar transferase [candidate division Zixibacteria bacterium]|nr:sugar transferase [candidate division Zixibacteria bacterium]